MNYETMAVCSLWTSEFQPHRGVIYDLNRRPAENPYPKLQLTVSLSTSAIQ